MRLVIAALLALTATAHADHDQTFADYHKATTVKDVAGFELATGDFNYVLVGRFAHDKYMMAGVVLLRCNAAQCQGRRVGFGSSEAIDVLGVVDLEGAPAAVPARKRRGSRTTGYTKLATGRMRFPVLVVQTEEREQRTETARTGKHRGTYVRTKLHLISLVEADRGSVVMHDTSYENGPSRTGLRRTYRLERSTPKGPLALIVTEQRHNMSRCKRPEPIEYRYQLDGRHYRTAEVLKPPAPGC